MIKRKLLFLLLIAVNMFCAYGQGASITGIVTAEDGEPLIGVTVIVEGASFGGITDIDGRYNISGVKPSDKLSFSFIGFEKQTIAVGQQSTIDVTLVSDSEMLDDLVVVGYGTQKKESVVGAITQVQSDELLTSGVQNVSQAITGKLSGVVTLQNDGMPGADDATILIRGKSTWGNASPLIMVDGVERSFSDLDPNEVETISVLKDASATAVYGSKGGNGVILVTTKRGIESKPKVNFTFSQGFKEPTGMPAHVDAYTTLSHANTAMKNDGSWGALYSQEELMHYKNGDQPYIYPEVNWAEEMLKIGTTTNANVNVRGGSKQVKYFASVGYLHEGDVVNTGGKPDKGDPDVRYYSDRFNLRSNLDFQLSKSTVLSTNAGGSIKNVNGPSGAMFSVFESIYAGSINHSPVYYGPDALEMYPDPLDPNASGMRYATGVQDGTNPYTSIYAGKLQTDGLTYLQTTEKKTVMDLNADFTLRQDLDFVTQGLSASALVSFGTNTIYTRKFKKKDAVYLLHQDETWSRFPDYNTDLTPLEYSGDTHNNYFNKLYYEFKINYDRTFNKDHYVTAMGIFNRRQNNIKAAEPYRMESWAARATYSYALRYMVELNMGYTGSEQFAPGQRFGFFPAYALGWNIGEEAFIKDNFDFINKMKVRYSYGVTGNDKTNQRWLYYSTMGNVGAVAGTTPVSVWMAWYGGGTNRIKPNQSSKEGPVPNLVAQWEEAIKQNIGLEMSLFSNHLTFSVDLFKESRDNILMEPRVVQTWVQVDFNPVNMGSTKNHGYELELGYNNSTTSGLNYFVRSNFSFTENRVVFQDDPPNLPEYQKKTNHPIGVQTGLITDGLFGSVDDVANYVKFNNSPTIIEGDIKYVDFNGDGVIDNLDNAPKELTTYPLYNYGITMGGDYKGFSVNMMVQGMSGKASSKMGLNSAPFMRSRNRMLEQHLDFWTPENPDAYWAAPHYNDVIRSTNNYKAGTKYGYVNTSFVRIKELQLAYSFRPKWDKLPVDYLMFFVSGNNLLTYTKYDGYMGDPEKSNFEPGARNSYPLLRRYNIGFKLNF